MRRSRCLLPILVLAAACGDSGTIEPRQHLPKPTTPTLTVLVSNQSFDLPEVDISIELDGKLAISGDFAVEGQHTWVPFDFDVAPGSHTISIASEAGDATLEKTFVMDDRKWVVVNYWYYATGPEPTPRQFSFSVFDAEPAFE